MPKAAQTKRNAARRDIKNICTNHRLKSVADWIYEELLCKRAVCRHLQTVLTEVLVGEINQKGYIDYVQMYVTGRGRRGTNIHILGVQH